jgi:AcrR family transcriptional regulator
MAVPAPSRTSLDAIVRSGRAVLDDEGIDALTMQRVAAAVGVRAPSLYKHVRDRDALIRLIAADVVRDLGALLHAAAATGDPRTDLVAIAHEFRAWARAHPGGYALLFSRVPDAWITPGPDADAIEPLLRTAAALAGPDHALEAARTVVAWASGFIGMELAGAFRMGGDVDAAFGWGIEHLAAAIAAPAR